MVLLGYSYRVTSLFCPPVGYHAFKLRAVPMECAMQHVTEHVLQVWPACTIMHAIDGLGNAVQYGSVSDRHERFCIESRGVVEVGGYCVPDDGPEGFYVSPTPLTSWNDDIRGMALGKNAAEIMHCVYRHLTYERFVTDNSTTAADVYARRHGVCQDYAHLMIAACRAVGLPARYVNGLTLGEGETHAWVEVHDGKGAWLGYDPTRDCEVHHGYLKLAHGRDVNDCPSNRGRFYQWTTESMTVNCKLEIL